MPVRSLIWPSLGVAFASLTCCCPFVSLGATELVYLSCVSLTVRLAAILHIGCYALKSLSSVFAIWSLGPYLTIVAGIPSFTSKIFFYANSGDVYFL